MWDSRVWMGSCVEEGKYSITYKFEICAHDGFVGFFGVYAPHTEMEPECSEEIAAAQSYVEAPVTRWGLQHRRNNGEERIALMLQCGDWEQRKAYFKFENRWLNVLSKVTFGNLTKKNNLLSELAETDPIRMIVVPTEDEMMIRATASTKLEELAKNEESSGDSKSVKGYGKTSWRPPFVITNFPRISQEEQEWMRDHFRKRLYTSSNYAMETKPPSDLVLLCFFKECLGIIKSDVMQTIHNFHRMKCLKDPECHFCGINPKPPGRGTQGF
ncbi:hypothetical protein H5410_064497 [Solanum commersonii]|uniref:Uncharacterized protein n=1 Tax=Solanum commersonii TaxID=4109 RepID=A0A9J5VZ87_SOLCO|nr:hypothetical protein H5410_064497 [Solanum commersonii]